jgi:hypothetical protein
MLLFLLLLLLLQPSRWPAPGDLQNPLPDLQGYPAGRCVFFDGAATAQLSASLGGLRRLQVLRLAGTACPPGALSSLSQLRELRCGAFLVWSGFCIIGLGARHWAHQPAAVAALLRVCLHAGAVPKAAPLASLWLLTNVHCTGHQLAQLLLQLFIVPRTLL